MRISLRKTVRRAASRKRKGQALVESALMLAMIISLLVSAFDFGQIFFIHQSLVERARITARYASMNYENADGAKNYFLYGTPQQPGAYTSRFLSVSPEMLSVTRFDADSNRDRMEVKVHDYPYQFFTPFLASAYTGKAITATAPTEARNGW